MSKFVVYITDFCREQAKNYSELNEIEKLAKKVESQTVIPNWMSVKHPRIRKKYLGKSYRLIAQEREIPGISETILCLLNVLPRSSSEYSDEFLNDPTYYCAKLAPTDTELLTYYSERFAEDPPMGIAAPSDLEYEYLYNEAVIRDETYGIVFESPEWVEGMKNPTEPRTRYYDLLHEHLIEDADPAQTVVYCQRSSAAILYRRIRNHLYLIAPINQDKTWEERLRQDYSNLLTYPVEDITPDALLRASRRSYPAIMLALDFTQWESIETNTTGNLALSPEESRILESVSQSNVSERAYPLFINGRPGSGKSTILQFLFAEHLYQHLKRADDGKLPYSPLYLTYNSRLLDHARKSVESILKSNSEMLSEGSIDLEDERVQSAIRESFGEFHRFLLGILPETWFLRFNPGRQVEYPRFRQLWLGKRKSLPEQNLRTLSPELVWHVIRTFIKGMRYEADEYLDPGEYAALPEKQRSVQQSLYERIWENVWENWYFPLSEQNGYWDTQDLTRAVLDLEDIDISKYPVVFCDEAQDFTQIELELILRLSLYSARMLEPIELKMVPFAFAGDPFQTLNPTGFNWESVKANFHDKIVKERDHTAHAKLDFNYRELSYNYRSTTNVVKFCNLLQLLRGILFDSRGLMPQKIWFDDENAPMPVYYSLDNPLVSEKLDEQTELVIIIPCQEGEEESYVAADPVLRKYASNHDGLLRNFLSPMTAKGLEFSRVVLYKFGDECVTKYPNLLRPLANGIPHGNHEEALPLQYFMNRLYVASSRAQKRLIIVDTPQGIQQIWARNEINRFSELLKKYQRGEWAEDDLAFATEGTAQSWSEDRDDPLVLAEALYENGMSERDPYKLKLAAANFYRAGKESHARKCDALRYEYEGSYHKAGETYLAFSTPDRANALRCLWLAGSYELIMNGPFINKPEQQAAYFILEHEKRSNICVRFLDVLTSFVDNLDLTESGDRWIEVCDVLIQALAKHSDENLPWKEIYEQLASVWKAGLRFSWNSSFGILAYHAGEYDVAVDIWESLNRSEYDQPMYERAKAQTAPYPDKLRWLSNTEQYEKIIVQWEHNQNEPLGERNKMYVANAYFAIQDYAKATKFLAMYPDEKRLQELLQISKTSVPNLLYPVLTTIIGIRLLDNRDHSAQWKRAIAMATAPELPDDVQQKLKMRLIYEAAISGSLPMAHIDDKAAMGDLLKFIWKHDQDLIKYVGISIMGSAIERAGKIIDSLEFYEDIWRTHQLEADGRTISFAKIRWLRCKMRQSERNSQNKRQRDLAEKQASEAKRQLAKWRIENLELENIPEYPNIDQESRELEQILRRFLDIDAGEISEPVMRTAPITLDDDQIKDICDLHSLKWSPEKIADTLKHPLNLVESVILGSC